MDLLPNEVLEKILLLVPVRYVLRGCRLVSKKWYHVSSSVCRKRHVTYKQIRYKYLQSGDHRLHSCNTTTFVSVDNLPWSSIQLHVDENIHGILSLAVVSTFGHQLRSLSICLQDTGFFNFMLILKHVPNVRLLHLRSLRSTLEPLIPFVYPPDGFFRLQKLEQLNIDHEDMSESGFKFLELLEFFLKKSRPALNSINHTFLDGVCETYLYRAIQMTQSIPKLSLELPYWIQSETWEFIAKQNNSDIVHLVLHRDHRFQGQDDRQFQLLEKFLSNCTVLANLELHEFIINDTMAVPLFQLLTLPVLKNVKKLTLSAEEHNDNSTKFFLESRYRDDEIVAPLWKPIKKFQLPYLESIHIIIDVGQHLRLEKVFDWSTGEESFATVRNLEFCFYEDDVYLAKVFPNVEKLKFTATPLSNMNAILSDLTNLAELHIKFACFEFENHDAILRRVAYEIQHLPKFQYLLLNGGKKEMHLRESGFNLLMSISPIVMVMSNIKMPMEWTSKLRIHHRRFKHYLPNQL